MPYVSPPPSDGPLRARYPQFDFMLFLIWLYPLNPQTNTAFSVWGKSGDTEKAQNMAARGPQNRGVWQKCRCPNT